MRTTKFTIELPYECDFTLKSALQKAMKQYWKESLIMTKSPFNDKKDEIWWQEAIDQTADIILQVLQQQDNQ